MRPFGLTHEDAHAPCRASRTRPRCRCRRGRAQDVELLAAATQFVLEQVAQQLHRHVLERQRRAVGQRLDQQAVLELERARSPSLPNTSRVGPGRQRRSAGRDVVDVERQGCGTSSAVALLAPRCAIRSAWRRRPADRTPADTGRRRAPGPRAGISREAAAVPVAAGGEAAHQASSSLRMDAIGASTVGSACICAIAASMPRLRACVVRQDDDVGLVLALAGPRAAAPRRCRCRAPPRMPVTSASTPAWSATRRRR